MQNTKKYHWLFGGLLIHSLILSFSPLLFFQWTSDVNLVLILAALAAFIPVIISQGPKELWEQLKQKRDHVSIGMLIVLLLAPTGTNIIGAFLGIGLEKLLALLGLAITQTGTEMANEVAQSAGLTLALYTCVVAPLFEELAFRNFLFRGMEQPRPWLAVMLSGLMFALMHGNLEQALTLIVTAIFFSYLAKRYAIWVAIAVHAINNSIFYTFHAIRPVSGSLMDQFNNVITLGGIIAFIIALVSAIRYFRSEREIGPKASPQYLKHPLFWLYFIYWIGMIIVNDFVL